MYTGIFFCRKRGGIQQLLIKSGRDVTSTPEELEVNRQKIPRTLKE
jgi:hypothetical protein